MGVNNVLTTKDNFPLKNIFMGDFHSFSVKNRYNFILQEAFGLDHVKEMTKVERDFLLNLKK
jgi:hypothetical protein